jgi:hypothetical protein
MPGFFYGHLTAMAHMSAAQPVAASRTDIPQPGLPFLEAPTLAT